VAGLEQGTLLFSIGCSENKQGRGEVGLGMTGVLPTQETVRWQQRALGMNDRIEVKIVETPTVDQYEVLQPASRDERKLEKQYVRRLAKEFGWTIQTGARPKIR
jgi:hypothetical protein